MDTSYLQPGYVTQGFSVARNKMYEGADFVKNKDYYVGYAAGVAATLLSKASEYAELPLRIIEDVALTAINLVGATFDKGCKANLKHCFNCLLNDGKDTLITLPIILFKWVAIAVVGYHVVRAILNTKPNLKAKADYQLMNYYRVKIIRKHGYNTIERMEKEFPSYARKKSPTAFLQLYKKVAELESKEKVDQLLDLISEEIKIKKGKMASGTDSWVCPENLKNDTSDRAKKIKNILSLSHNVNLKSLSCAGKKALLCNMLEIPTSSTDEEIKRNRKLYILLLHPDKNGNDKNCENAFKALQDAYNAYFHG